jgi:hypothetical protein
MSDAEDVPDVHTVPTERSPALEAMTARVFVTPVVREVPLRAPSGAHIITPLPTGAHLRSAKAVADDGGNGPGRPA